MLGVRQATELLIFQHFKYNHFKHTIGSKYSRDNIIRAVGFLDISNMNILLNIIESVKY